MHAITDDQVARFGTLYRGYADKIGRYTIAPDQGPGAKVEGTARTVKGPPSPALYRAHLEGKRGLGIIPLMPDGSSVHFGAIDVDDYSGWYELTVLAHRIRHLPLTCTESKSGGLHIWLHSKAGLPARVAVAFLAKVRDELGLSKDIEIFPKQTQRSPGDVGNWINTPHFGDTRAVFWFGGKDGDITPGPRDLDAFLNLAERNADLCTESYILEYTRALAATVDVAAPVVPGQFDPAQLPPCLRSLFYGLQFVEDGQRDVAFFNLGKALARVFPGDADAIATVMLERNAALPAPLPAQQVLQKARAAAKTTKPNYQCNKQPMKGLCDRATCETRALGVTPRSKATALPTTFHAVRKVMSFPPQWEFDIDGYTIRADSGELLSPRHMHAQILEATGIAHPYTSNAVYMSWITAIVADAEEVPAPHGMDLRSIVSDALLLFIDEAAERTGNAERFFMGRVLVSSTEAMFSIRHFRKHLHRDGVRPAPGELVEALQSLGCTHQRTTIAGRSTDAWVASRTRLPFAAPSPYTREEIAAIASHFDSDLDELAKEKAKRHKHLM